MKDLSHLSSRWGWNSIIMGSLKREWAALFYQKAWWRVCQVLSLGCREGRIQSVEIRCVLKHKLEKFTIKWSWIIIFMRISWAFNSSYKSRLLIRLSKLFNVKKFLFFLANVCYFLCNIMRENLVGLISV